MVKKIEHIGIAVEDIETSIELFESLLGEKCYKEERIDSEGVITAFFKVGESKIELLQATRPDSAIAKFLQKGKRGIHHLAFEVDDMESELHRLKTKGFVLIHESPIDGADNKRIAFLHPGSTDGVLVELCQEK